MLMLTLAAASAPAPARAQAPSGQAPSGQAASGQAASGQAASGQAASGQAASGQAASGQAPSGAAPQNDAAKRAARELANKGFEHLEAGEYAKAIDLFRQAEEKFHAPTILLMWGQAHEKNGGFVEAQAIYRRVVGEALPADAPQEFRDAQSKARAALDGLTGKTAILKIVIKGMTADKVRVTIDDVEIPTAQLTQPIPQNPGAHKIMATIGGEEKGRAVFQSVTLNPGTTKQIQLVFRPGSPSGAVIDGSGGGCASCEIGAAPRDGSAGLSWGLLASLLLLRRRRSGSQAR